MTAYADVRRFRIKEIQSVWKKALLAPDRSQTMDEVIQDVCVRYGVSRRTAREYIFSAKARVISAEREESLAIKELEASGAQ